MAATSGREPGVSVGAPLQPGDPSRVGPYELVSILGSGGMGKVYLGRSPGGWLVAVKVIRAELAADDEFRVRFRREVAAARKVSGLYTAMVVDADVDDPVPWLATAYIAGQSLADRIAGQGPLRADALHALAAGLAEGLAAIHAVGLVHRDLKPSNVLLAEDGPRVIDFGISRAMEATVLTKTGVVLGTPEYMSPEQAEGHVIGPASDVFGLGGVLVYAATGHGPFGGGKIAALIYRVVHSPPDLDGVPGEIRSMVARCLDKDPGRRPTPADILAELGARAWEAGAGTAGAGPAIGPAAAVPAAALAETPSTVTRVPPPVRVPLSDAPTLGSAPAGHPPGTQGPPSRPRARTRVTAIAAGLAAVAALAVALPLTLLAPGRTTGSPGQPGSPRASGSVKAAGSPSALVSLLGIYPGDQYGFPGARQAVSDGTNVWVADVVDNSVSEFNARTHARERTLSGGRYGFSTPRTLVDDGKHVWVANQFGNSVTELDAANGSWIRTISGSQYHFDGPSLLALDGSTLWVASWPPGSEPNDPQPAAITEVNTSDGSLVRTLSGFYSPAALVADGSRLWVLNPSPGDPNQGGYTAGGGTLVEIGAADGTVQRTIPLSASNPAFRSLGGMLLHGTDAWVITGIGPTTGYMAEIDTGDGKVVHVVTASDCGLQTPADIAAYGSHMFVVNEDGNSLSVLDAHTGACLEVYRDPAATPGTPFETPVSLTVDGNQAWVVNAGNSANNAGNSSVVELAVS
jgi:Protein kinase domain